MKLFSITDVGRRREINEDYIYTSDKPVGHLPNLFIVADGMGGHNGGDYASKHAVEKAVEVIGNDTQEYDAENILQKAIDDANTYINKMSRMNEKLKGMGTTFVAATVEDNRVTVANVGDSRLYVINDFITQITKDHSLVEEMVDMGGIDRETARTHPDKNIITRAVGVKEYVLVDFFDVHISEKEKLLLCTDGLTNMLKDDEIHRIINSSSSLEEAGKRLIEAANANGGRDNIAVVLVEPFGGQND
ncbi:MAG: Stp1/IreP family PP2C-type Ser/Thr phosphatase [Lachnospiraceae bacterium]|nr:Stp1/IreP family PP2C-type Ser/Thr phosphatase [Lachnospiraceae bacterium]MBO5145930.1 Stp1/IreP family PP2C-type Ser/Thr phosphatase [Lachnospiraceae bacterium]